MSWRRALSEMRPIQGAAAWMLTILFAAAAVALRARYAVWLDQTPFLVFFPPTALCAVLCGWRPAGCLLALFTAVAWHFFFRLHGPAAPPELPTLLRLTGFVCVGGIFIGTTGALQSAVARLHGAVHLQESLFRELQHRTANNMQVVASMLAQTRRAIVDPGAREVVERAEARIRSMGELHRRLYDPRGYAGGFEKLLHDTLNDLFLDLPVRVQLEIRALPLSTEQVSLLTLLVIEAATNAAKHVFRAGCGSRFEVSLITPSPGRLLLRMADDGPGMAREMLAESGSRRLGVGIMQSLARQLGGTLELAAANGTQLSVNFPAVLPS